MRISSISTKSSRLECAMIKSELPDRTKLKPLGMEISQDYGPSMAHSKGGLQCRTTYPSLILTFNLELMLNIILKRPLAPFALAVVQGRFALPTSKKMQKCTLSSRLRCDPISSLQQATERLESILLKIEKIEDFGNWTSLTKWFVRSNLSSRSPRNIHKL